MKKNDIGSLFRRSKILVVGDLILDRFITGSVRRISPEAPVPVVEVVSERSALGGAANVANNIKALGGKAMLVGIVGDDAFGKELVSEARKAGLDGKGILLRKGGTTIVKTRVMAHHQQVVRVDREKTGTMPREWQAKMKSVIGKKIGEAQAIVVSDYAKGTFSKELLKWIGDTARKRKIPYIVDPKPANFPYPGATIVTPNRGEAQGFLVRGPCRSRSCCLAILMFRKHAKECLLRCCATHANGRPKSRAIRCESRSKRSGSRFYFYRHHSNGKQ